MKIENIRNINNHIINGNIKFIFNSSHTGLDSFKKPLNMICKLQSATMYSKNKKNKQ